MAYTVRAGHIVKRIELGADGIARSIETQPTEAREMQRIKQIREGGTQRRLEWGQALVGIPEIKLLELYRRFPDLNSPDGQIQTAAWKRWAASAEAAPYRLTNRRGKGRMKR